MQKYRVWKMEPFWQQGKLIMRHRVVALTNRIWRQIGFGLERLCSVLQVPLHQVVMDVHIQAASPAIHMANISFIPQITDQYMYIIKVNKIR